MLISKCLGFWRYLLRSYRFRRKSIKIAKGTFVDHSVTIGRATRINNASYITACDIGAYCAIGGRLIVRSTNHDARYLNIQDWCQKEIIGSVVSVTGVSKGKVIIGNNVWIGDSVIVLSGVSIGDGAVIGAGSVVTKSIPAYAVAVGNPARVIKYRFSPEKLEIIRNLKWWDWSINAIRRNRHLFELNLDSCTIDDLTAAVEKLHFE